MTSDDLFSFLFRGTSKETSPHLRAADSERETALPRFALRSRREGVPYIHIGERKSVNVGDGDGDGVGDEEIYLPGSEQSGGACGIESVARQELSCVCRGTRLVGCVLYKPIKQVRHYHDVSKNVSKDAWWVFYPSCHGNLFAHSSAHLCIGRRPASQRAVRLIRPHWLQAKSRGLRAPGVHEAERAHLDRDLAQRAAELAPSRRHHARVVI